MAELFPAYKSNESKKIEHIIHASLALAGGALWKSEANEIASFILIASITASAVGYCYWYMTDWIAYRVSQTESEQRKVWLGLGVLRQAFCFLSILLSYMGSIIALMLKYIGDDPRFGYNTRGWMFWIGTSVVLMLAVAIFWDFRKIQKRSYS